MLEIWICNGMSLMRRRKSIGPMMVPWGIPWSMGNRDDVHPCTLSINPRLKFTSTGSKRHGLKSGVLVSSANLYPPCFSKQSLQVCLAFKMPQATLGSFALRFSYSPRCAPLESVRRVCWQWHRNWLATTKRLPEDLVCATTPKNMQQGVQRGTRCNIHQCWELLASNVASVCT